MDLVEVRVHDITELKNSSKLLYVKERIHL